MFGTHSILIANYFVIGVCLIVVVGHAFLFKSSHTQCKKSCSTKCKNRKNRLNFAHSWMPCALYVVSSVRTCLYQYQCYWLQYDRHELSNGRPHENICLTNLFVSIWNTPRNSHCSNECVQRRMCAHATIMASFLIHLAVVGNLFRFILFISYSLRICQNFNCWIWLTIHCQLSILTIAIR